MHVPFGQNKHGAFAPAGVLAGGGPFGAFLPDEGDLLGAFPSPCLGPPFPLPLALRVFFAPGGPFGIGGAFGLPGAPGACVAAFAAAPLALAAAFRSRSSFSLCFFFLSSPAPKALA